MRAPEIIFPILSSFIKLILRTEVSTKEPKFQWELPLITIDTNDSRD